MTTSDTFDLGCRTCSGLLYLADQGALRSMEDGDSECCLGEDGSTHDPIRVVDNDWRQAARNQFGIHGVEVGHDAVVSRGDAAGAYVQAWVWVEG